MNHYCLLSQSIVTIDSTIKYQTIEGWGHGGCLFSGLGGFYSLQDTSISQKLSLDYLDYLIDELGLTGSRIWEVGPRVDGTGSDSGDCDSLDWSKFQEGAFYSWYHPYVKYFSYRIKAKGYKTSFYSSPTYPTFATAFKPWVLNHPGERAQQILGNALFWKNKYDIDMNYAVIYNEPTSPVTSNILVEDAKAAGKKLLENGLITKIQFAEAVAPVTNWNFISPVQNDSDLWANVSRISYHNYGGADNIYRPNMRDFAKKIGITTAQTEMGDPNFDDLYNDLTLGGVSYWEVAFASGNVLPLKGGQTQFGFGSKYFRLRQVLHYVRPGDVRISTMSNDTNLKVLAFNNNGKITTILESLTSSKTVTINGLPAGTYGVSQSAGQIYQEMGLKTIVNDGIINLEVMGSSGATTIYPYSGSNHPPTIVSYNTDKGYIFAPTISVNLSVYAVDPELDRLTYQWSVFKQPSGSNAVIASPTSTNSAVNGITNSGMYIFKIDVSDGTSTSTKKVYMYKYDANPPAQIGQSGFRFAQPYGLVFAGNPDTTIANIELPTSTCTLQVGISDLAGSNFSGRGKWTLESAPVGSKVKIDTTIFIYVSIRAQVSNMDIPGEYVFRVVVKDPPYQDLATVIKCILHPTSSAPVISSITANPAKLTLPLNSTQLIGKTSDPEDDLLRHWWAIKSVPIGAKPIFNHQGLAITKVKDLNIPGTYTFTLRTFDDLHISTKDISIIVNNSQNNIDSDLETLNENYIYPNPFSDEINIKLNENNPEIKIQINDIFGKIVFESDQKNNKIINNILNIDTSKLLSGIYFLKLIQNNHTLIYKILKI